MKNKFLLSVSHAVCDIWYGSPNGRRQLLIVRWLLIACQGLLQCPSSAVQGVFRTQANTFLGHSPLWPGSEVPAMRNLSMNSFLWDQENRIPDSSANADRSLGGNFLLSTLHPIGVHILFYFLLANTLLPQSFLVINCPFFFLTFIGMTLVTKMR